MVTTDWSCSKIVQFIKFSLIFCCARLASVFSNNFPILGSSRHKPISIPAVEHLLWKITFKKPSIILKPFYFRNRASRRLPAIHPTSNLPCRLRRLLRADRVRPSAETDLQRADLLQQLQPVLPPETISLLPVEDQSPRSVLRPEPVRLVLCSESASRIQKVRFPVSRDAGQRAMPAGSDVRLEREEDRISELPQLRLDLEATDRRRVFVRRAARLPDSTCSGRLQLKLTFLFWPQKLFRFLNSYHWIHPN